MEIWQIFLILFFQNLLKKHPKTALKKNLVLPPQVAKLHTLKKVCNQHNTYATILNLFVEMWVPVSTWIQMGYTSHNQCHYQRACYYLIFLCLEFRLLEWSRLYENMVSGLVESCWVTSGPHQATISQKNCNFISGKDRTQHYERVT